MAKILNLPETQNDRLDSFTNYETSYDAGGPVIIEKSTTETITNTSQISKDQFTQSTSDIHTRKMLSDVSKEIIPTKDLYPLMHELNPILSTASQLLEEGNGILLEALMYSKMNDCISSDDAIQRFQVLLPELFCCRSLGDGFGIIVSALYHSIKNYIDKPLSEKQIDAILKLVDKIANEPFIDFDTAVENIMILEDFGFDLNPSHFHFASDLLSE